jgi:hypothetical protein
VCRWHYLLYYLSWLLNHMLYYLPTLTHTLLPTHFTYQGKAKKAEVPQTPRTVAVQQVRTVTKAQPKRLGHLEWGGRACKGDVARAYVRAPSQPFYSISWRLPLLPALPSVALLSPSLTHTLSLPPSPPLPTHDQPVPFPSRRPTIPGVPHLTLPHCYSSGGQRCDQMVVRGGGKGVV